MAKILIIDDEASIRETLANILRDEGHQPTLCDSGEAAIAQFAREEYDLVFRRDFYGSDAGHALLDAMQAGNAAKLASIPENMFQAGTSEIKNWIVVAGAMAEAGLKMSLVDYVPCYRSEAGTGSAMGFARWC